MIHYATASVQPARVGPQPDNGSGGWPVARSQFNNDHSTDHLGGIQATGHYLGGGFDGNGGQGVVMHWDADASGQPDSAFVPVYGWTPGQNASAVGLAKITGQNAPMVMVVGGRATAFVRVLRKRPNRWGYTNPMHSDNDSSWIPSHTDWPSDTEYSSPASWPDGSLDVSTEWPNAKGCCANGACSYCGSTRQLFQSLQLLVESDPTSHAFRRLFLAGAYSSEELTAGRLEDGTDEVTLFEIHLTEQALRAPASQGLGLVAKTRTQVNGDRRMVFACAYDDSRQCSFNASFGLFVDPDREALSAYSSKAWRPDNGPITITEFGPPVVAAGDNEVVLCSEPNFGGQCEILNLEEKFFAKLDSTQMANDSTRSIRVGAKVTVELFDQSEFRFGQRGSDWRTYGPGNYPTLDGFDKRISSVIVHLTSENPQRPGPGQVTVCEGANGTSLCSVLSRGDYRYPAGPSSKVNATGGSFGICNDWMSSVILPPGGRVILYWNDQLGGASLNLYNGGSGYRTYNLADYGWDGVVSSVTVP
jgi:hypothetical protein